MTADPDRACPHHKTEITAHVMHLTKGPDGPVEGYSVELRLNCTECGDRFQWIGLPMGYSPGQPMSDVEGFVLRAPVRPESMSPDFGRGLPGVGITVPGGVDQ